MATKTTKPAPSDYVTHADLEEFGNDVSKRIVDDLSEVVAGLAQTMHHELTGVRQEIADIRRSTDKLTNTIGGFIKRLDDIETDNTARDAQLARLERWIEQVAKKTGVKLEY